MPPSSTSCPVKPAVVSWSEFERAAPELAAVGRELLYRPDCGEVGILATVDAAGSPRVAPVCPIFSDAGIYLSVRAHTPKCRHLKGDGRYALHALVGGDDLEFQISGRVRLVGDADERRRVIAAIPFPSFGVDDPIFELEIERALVVSWPEGGERGDKRAWSAD